MGIYLRPSPCFKRWRERSSWTETFSIFKSLYVSKERYSECLQFYERIIEIGLRRDVVTYRMILQVICEEEVVQGVGNVTQDLMVSYASSMSNVYLSS